MTKGKKTRGMAASSVTRLAWLSGLLLLVLAFSMTAIGCSNDTGSSDSGDTALEGIWETEADSRIKFSGNKFTEDKFTEDASRIHYRGNFSLSSGSRYKMTITGRSLDGATWESVNEYMKENELQENELDFSVTSTGTYVKDGSWLTMTDDSDSNTTIFRKVDSSDGIPDELVGQWVYQGLSGVVIEFTRIGRAIVGETSYYTLVDKQKTIKCGTELGSINEVLCDSYTIENGILTLTGGKSAELNIQGGLVKNSTMLIMDHWENGSDSSGSEIWYSFPVTAGTTYYLWWNDIDGNGDKKADIYVYAYYSDMTGIELNDNDNGWTESNSFTAAANGTVYLKVYIGDYGNYSIVYSTNSTRPLIGADYTVTFRANGGSGIPPLSQLVPIGSSITLPDGDGLSKEGYTFGGWSTDSFGTSGHNYNVGDDYYPQGDTILYARWISGSSSGVPPDSSITLTAGEWKWEDGTNSTDKTEVWYSFSVTSGTTYYIWWSDRYQNSEKNGSTKWEDVKVSAYYGDGKSIFLAEDEGFGKPQSFKANSSGIVYVKVFSYFTATNLTGGQYGIVYSTSNSRPNI